MKKNSPGCATVDCCGVSTCVCDALSYFSISGLNNSLCTSGCNGRNGTYVFRTAPGGCIWGGFLNTDNCGLVPGAPENYYVGSQSSPCFEPADMWGVGLQVVAGKLRVTVSFEVTARHTVISGIVGQTSLAATFRQDFNSCAEAVGATLPLFSMSPPSNCVSSLGDFCNLAGATVTIG